MSLPDYLEETKTYLLNQDIPENPEAVVILGSGLSGFGEQIKQPHSISYADIPHFPLTSVKGHDGRLISGRINGKHVVAFAGRFHHYEGYTFEQTALPVYLAKALGAQKLIISNAAGAINTRFEVGDLMVIDDVIRQNLTVTPAGMPKHRYNGYTYADRVRELAATLKLTIQRGTYLYTKGPNYETKAEIRAFRTMGADAVGMSTAPELFEAARLELKAVAISLISNMACGVTKGKLDHNEVKAAAETRKNDFARLVKALVEHL